MSKTKEMIRILFPDTKNIDEVSETIDKYRMNFGVNTDLRLAMFLAQVREEIGTRFEPKVESLNYTVEALTKTFKSITPDQAKLYGRTSTQKANQEAIANIVYANRMGNGDEKSGDGWKYRGRGTLQITGKYNYQEVQKRIDKYSPNSGINILEDSSVDTLKGAILIGLGFWVQYDLHKIADRGTDLSVVDAITTKINKYTTSYEKRREHFLSIKHLIGV